MREGGKVRSRAKRDIQSKSQRSKSSPTPGLREQMSLLKMSLIADVSLDRVAELKVRKVVKKGLGSLLRNERPWNGNKTGSACWANAQPSTLPQPICALILWPSMLYETCNRYAGRHRAEVPARSLICLTSKPSLTLTLRSKP